MADASGNAPTISETDRVHPVTRRPALTVALKDKQSRVRRFIDECYGRTAELQRNYRAAVGPLVVDGAGDAGTLGGAFDWMTRFLLHPNPDLSLASIGTVHRPALKQALIELTTLLGYIPDDDGRISKVARFDGPVTGSEVNPQLLARGCWALTLLTELYRISLLPGSPLTRLDRRHVSAQDLLDLAPQHAIDQLLALREHVLLVLLPAMATRRGPWALGPTFDGSRFMNADADLIAAGLLLELKTNLGDKRPDGTRRAQLDGQTLKQLVGYVLLDLTDEFTITHVGVYNARYAHHMQWPLQDLLEELAGHHVDLEAERAAFRTLLLSGVEVRRA